MARWAVFDVDGTLFPPTSMERSFIDHMLQNGVLPFRNIFYYFLMGAMKSFTDDKVDAFKNNKFYLAHIPAKPIEVAARRFVKYQIFPNVSSQGLKKIEYFQTQNYKILIMSGSPSFLTLPLCEKLTPNAIITTYLEIKNDCFTGKVDGFHPYGQRKTLLLQQRKNHLDLDFQQSVVFANHHSDTDHMSLFGEAVAVNPTAKLKQIALGQEWRIEYWE